MHHLTTLNLPTAPSRESDRRNLLLKVGAYLAGGGSIQEVPHTERAPHRATSWNTGITRNRQARREYERQQIELADRIRALAMVETDLGPIQRSSTEIMQALKRDGLRLNTVAVEQIAAKNGIALRDPGRCRA